MSNSDPNKYLEEIADRKEVLKHSSAAPLMATVNLNTEVDATGQTEPARKNFDTYLYPDTLLENVASRYKI